MSQPQSAPQDERPSPAEQARKARARWRRRVIGYTLLAALVLPPVIDVVSDPYGEVSDWYYAAALEDFAHKNTEQAEAKFAKSLEWSPKTQPRVHAARARHFAASDQFAKALEEVDKAIALSGETTSLMQLRALYTQRLKLHAEAVAAWEKIMTSGLRSTWFDRIFPDGYTQRKSLLLNAVAYAKGVGSIELDTALEEVDESLKLIPGKDVLHRAMVLDTRGVVRYRQGDNRAALQDLDKSVTLFEDYLQAAADQLAEDEHNEVIRKRRFKGLLSDINSQLAVILYHRALVHQALDQELEAEADLRRVREIIGREPDETLF
jgi:tetratricopeptide (TPR) repeat protein